MKNVSEMTYFVSSGTLNLITQLECGSMPNVMADLLNIGGALCESSVP